MRRVVASLAVGFWLCGAAAGSAQDSGKLALLIPELFGPSGLKVDSQARLPDGSTHSAHFNSAFQAEFTQFNIALASQLAAVPLPTPASGFTYTFDSALGVFQRSTQSFGPILTERAETIGKKKVTFGVTYQHFGFDSLEGVSLGSVPAVFTHDDSQLGGGRSDLVTTTNSIDASVDQTVAFLSYGLGSRFDLSVAVPFVTVDLAAQSQAQVQRIGTATSPATHFYDDGSGGFGTTRDLRELGPRQRDRRRRRAPQGQPRPQRGRSRLALGIDGRFPTGDEEDLLGLGAYGVKPFARPLLLPGPRRPPPERRVPLERRERPRRQRRHRQKEDLPDQVQYAVGVDIGVDQAADPGLRLPGDLRDRLAAPRPRDLHRRERAGVPADRLRDGVVQPGERRGGPEVQPRGPAADRLQLLFKLDSAGLRDNVTPLFGIEYAF